MGPKERKEREKAERREEIITAGEKLFLTKGLVATTMDDIAKEAEVSKGTLYLYFSSKEELYLTITYRAVGIMHDMISESLAGVEGVFNRMKCFGEAHVRFAELHRDHFRILMDLTDHSLFRKENLREIGLNINAKAKEIWKLVTDMIDDGKREGLFKETTDSFEVAISFWAFSTMMLQMKSHVGENEWMREEFHDPFFDVDFDTIMRRNAQRIIYSILKNPPDDFEFM